MKRLVNLNKHLKHCRLRAIFSLTNVVFIYAQLKAEGEEATRRFQTIVRLMNDEIVKFQEQKTLDMGLAFHEFAKGQAQLASGIAEAWRSLLPKLEACSSS